MGIFPDGVTHATGVLPKIYSLIGALVLRRGEPLRRDALAFRLWPDDDESTARTNLRRHLHRLTQILTPGCTALQTTTTTIAWNPAAPQDCDLLTFETARTDCTRFEEAVRAYGGDFLDGQYDDWIITERERLRDALLAMLDALVLERRSARDFTAAIDFAQTSLRFDPWREASMRSIITLRYAHGDRAGALADFERFAQRLRAELGTEPMPETQAIYDAVRRNAAIGGTTGAGESDQVRTETNLPFIGRVAELDSLRARWTRAAGGRGDCVFVSGEAGIGKSRLVSELALRAEAEGARVLFGTTSAPERTPYEAIAGALRGALPMISAIEIDVVRRNALATLIPELRAPGDADDGSNRPAAVDDLFEAIASTFAALSTVRPLLLVLEDLHWAGNATLQLLERIARTSPDATLLIAATFRDDDIGGGHPIHALRRGLMNDNLASTIAPARFDRTEIRLFAQRALTDDRDETVDALVQSSEGNAFFLDEAIRARRAGIDVVDSAKRASHIIDRITRIGDEARSVAEIAAVIGNTFAVDLVCKTSGWNEGVVLRALDSLIDEHIIRSARSSERGDYAFRHHVLREYVYANVEGATAQRLHRRIGTLLSIRGDDDARDAADHFERAAMPTEASLAYLGAAREADRRFAADDALGFARASANLAGDSQTRFDARTVFAKIAERFDARNEMDAAIAALERDAGRLAIERTLDRPAIDTVSELRTKMRRIDGMAALNNGTLLTILGNVDEALVTLKAGYAAFAEASDDRMRSIIANNIAYVLYKLGREREAFVFASEGLALARASATPMELGSMLACAGRVEFLLGNRDIGLRYMAEGLALYENDIYAAGDRAEYADALRGTGQLATARVQIDRAVEDAHRAGLENLQNPHEVLWFAACIRRASDDRPGAYELLAHATTVLQTRLHAIKAEGSPQGFMRLFPHAEIFAASSDMDAWWTAVR